MSKGKAVGESITGLVSLLCTVTFLLIGLLTGIWHPTWLVFLLIPVTSMIVGIVGGKKDILGMATGIVSLLSAIGFLLIGFLVEGAWRVCWIIFFAIPITSIIVKMATSGKDGEQKHAEDEGQ